MTTINLLSAFEVESATKSVAEQSILGFINGATRGLGSDQDLVYFGNEPEYKWGVLLDCHGTDRFKNLLKTFDWKTIMSHVEPAAILHELIKGANGFYGKNSGSTMILIKIFVDRIQTFCIGDSRVAIYKNGQLAYINCPHTNSNPLEIERLKDLRVEYELMVDPYPNISSSTILRGKIGIYNSFYDDYGQLLCRISPTQAIGHNGATGYCVEKHVETFNLEDDIRVVAGSDGVFDMFLLEGEVAEDVEQDRVDINSMTVEQLLQKAENRWKQSWKYHWCESRPEIMYETTFPANIYDDLGIIIWDNKKAV